MTLCRSTQKLLYAVCCTQVGIPSICHLQLRICFVFINCPCQTHCFKNNKNVRCQTRKRCLRHSYIQWRRNDILCVCVWGGSWVGHLTFCQPHSSNISAKYANNRHWGPKTLRLAMIVSPNRWLWQENDTGDQVIKPCVLKRHEERGLSPPCCIWEGAIAPLVPRPWLHYNSIRMKHFAWCTKVHLSLHPV